MAELQASFPRLLSMPLRLVPNVVHSSALSLVLNRVFERLLAEGELDFLEGKVLRIAVDDAGIEYRLTKTGDRMAAVDRQRKVDASIAGSVYDFMVLATRREDHDSLFFQRRLRMEGDTEVGLQLKNLLDSLDYAVPLPPVLQAAGERAVDLYQRLVGRADA